MANVVVGSTWGSGSSVQKLNDGSSDSVLAIGQDRLGVGTASPSETLEVTDGGNARFNRSKIVLMQESAPGALTTGLNSTAGNLAGGYQYKVVLVTDLGETEAGTESAERLLIGTDSDKRIDLSSIPTGTTDIVTGRKIYRKRTYTPLPASCSSLNWSTDKRKIESTAHNLYLGATVKLPGDTAGAYADYTISEIVDADIFKVTVDLTTELTGALGYQKTSWNLFKYVTTISGNSPSATYTDNLAETELGTNPPTTNTTANLGIGVTSPLASLHNNGDFITKGPWIDVRAFGAKGDGVTDDYSAIQTALNTNGPKTVFFPAGKYRITQELVVPNLTNIVGAGKYTIPQDKYMYAFSWIFFDSEETENDMAVLRVSREAVGTEPALSTWSVSIANIIIDGNDKAGFGLYTAGATYNSYFEKITIRKCNQHGLFTCKTWYATFRDIWTIDCKGCGMTFGPNPDVMGTAPFYPSWDDVSINGVLFENLYANGCGTSFTTQTQNDAWTKDDKHKGYGIGIYSNTSCSFINLVCENNRGAGLLYSPRHSTNIVRGLYLEENCLISGAKWPGLNYAYGLIYVGQSNQRGSVVENVYMNASAGEAQSIWLTGEEGESPLILRNIWCGEKIESDNNAYVLNDCDPALYSLVEDSSGSTGAGFITNGNIGAGTAEPEEKLVLDDVDNYVGLQLGLQPTRAKIVSWSQAGNAWAPLDIRACSGEGSQLYLATSGYLGVGTTSPQKKLHVYNNGESAVKVEAAGDGNDARVILDVPAASASYGTIDFYKAGTMKCQLYLNANTNNDLYVDMKSNGNFLIQNGCVGVGTTSPSEKLDVNGNIKISGGTGLILPQLTSAPGSPADGTIAYADGTSWNPGSGKGIYAYYSSTWNKLG